MTYFDDMMQAKADADRAEMDAINKRIAEARNRMMRKCADCYNEACAYKRPNMANFAPRCSTYRRKWWKFLAAK